MRQWTAARALLVGGSIAGALDILFAITFAFANGVAPMRLLQSVASGLLGRASYSGGLATAALGLGLHFLMSFLFAGAYLLASRRVPWLNGHALLAGAAFGIGVFFFMRGVVLPLSAFPHQLSFTGLAAAMDLLSHIILFGTPIALAARRAMPAPQAYP